VEQYLWPTLDQRLPLISPLLNRLPRSTTLDQRLPLIVAYPLVAYPLVAYPLVAYPLAAYPCGLPSINDCHLLAHS